MKKIFLYIALLISFSASAQIGRQQGAYNARDYGFKDDSATDNTALARTFFASLPDGARVYFPGGGKGYSYSDSIMINKGIYIFGDGAGSYPFYTVLDTPQKSGTTFWFNSGSKDFFHIRASGATNKNPTFNMTDIAVINSTVAAPTAGSPIAIYDNTAHHNFTRVRFQNFFTDFLVVSANFINWESCDFVAPISVGVDLGNTGQVDLGVFKFHNCNIISGYRTGLAAIGVYYRGGGYIDFNDCHFNAQGVFSTNTQFIYQFLFTFEQGQSSDVFVHDCLFENYQTNGIFGWNRLGGTSLALYNINISNNMVSPFGVGLLATPGIIIRGYQNVVLSNNLGNNLSGTPAISTNPFIWIDSCIQVVVTPATQNGWSNYDSISRSVVGQFVANGHNQEAFLNPYYKSYNSSQGITINNTNGGSSSTAAITLNDSTSSAFIYAPNLSYGFGLANDLVFQKPSGDIVLYTAAQALTVKNNGHTLLNTATDNTGWLQISANTTTDPAIYIKPSAAVNISSIVRGQLWDNGSNLYYGTGAGTKIDLLAGGGGGMAIGGPITSATAGSVLFADGSANLGQDNANFFYDATNHRLGIGTTAPGTQLHVKAANPLSLVENSTAGTGNAASFQLRNDLGSGHALQFVKTSSTFTGATDMSFIQELSGNDIGINLGITRVMTLHGTSVGIGSNGVGAAPVQPLEVRKDQNASSLITINNNTNNTAATAGLQMVAGSTNGYIYTTPSSYTTYPNTTFIQNPTGDVVVYTANPSFKLTNSGHSLFGTLVDNSAFIQPAANTTTVASMFFNGSSVDVTSPTNGMLWYNSTAHTLNFQDNSVTKNILPISATYTPSLTNTLNIGASTLSQASYTQIGNIVTVSVGIAISPTTGATNSSITVGLPINTATTSQLEVGTGSWADNSGTGGYSGARVDIQSASTARIFFQPASSSNGQIQAVFMYKIN